MLGHITDVAEAEEIQCQVIKFCYLKVIEADTESVCAQMVIVIDLESLDPYCCGFKSRQGLCILSCEENNQLAYETFMVLFRCPLVPEIMHRGIREVFLHQKSRHITF